MIAKVKMGRSFGGLIRYLHDGPRDKAGAPKQAEVLDYQGVRPDREAMIRDFDRHRRLNPDLGNAVWHTALAFAVEDADKLDNSKMVKLAEQYMRRLHIDPEKTQYVLIRHSDKAHPHVHLVLNRVDYDGRTISDQYSQGRSKEAALALAREHGLTVADTRDRAKSLASTAHQPERFAARAYVGEHIRQVLPHCQTLLDLGQQLCAHQIRLEVKKRRDGQAAGVVFHYDGHHLKGSEIDRQFSAGGLLKQLAAQPTPKKIIQPEPAPTPWQAAYAQHIAQVQQTNVHHQQVNRQVRELLVQLGPDPLMQSVQQALPRAKQVSPLLHHKLQQYVIAKEEFQQQQAWETTTRQRLEKDASHWMGLSEKARDAKKLLKYMDDPRTVTLGEKLEQDNYEIVQYVRSSRKKDPAFSFRAEDYRCDEQQQPMTPQAFAQQWEESQRPKENTIGSARAIRSQQRASRGYDLEL